jgi:maleate isomerase
VTEHRLSVGVVTPHAAAGPEVELPTMTRGRVTTVLSRTAPPSASQSPSQPRWQPPSGTAPPGHAELRTSTEDAAIDRAAVTFAGTALDAVAHASTTTGYVIGARGEAALVARLSQRFEVPAVASCAAAAAALRAHRVGKVQLVHPPWFDDDFDQLGAAYFRSQGFDTVVTKADDLPGDPSRVEPQSVIDRLRHHLDDTSEAVFLAGNGLRAAAAVEELEERTGRLVLAANQALLWAILDVTHKSWDVTGYGRLLRLPQRGVGR